MHRVTVLCRSSLENCSCMYSTTVYMAANHQEIIMGCCPIFCSLICPWFLEHVLKDAVCILPTSPKHRCINRKREHCKEHRVQVSRIAVILTEKAAELSSITECSFTSLTQIFIYYPYFHPLQFSSVHARLVKFSILCLQFNLKKKKEIASTLKIF